MGEDVATSGRVTIRGTLRHVGPPTDFPVETLQDVVGPDLLPVGGVESLKKRTPRTMLSMEVAGMEGKSIIRRESSRNTLGGTFTAHRDGWKP
jgi:hypothetical protein